MVEHFDSKEMSCPEKIPGDSDVRIRRGRISARMVVHEDDRVCCPYDGRPEHLSGVNGDRVENPCGDDVVALYPSSGGQEEGNKGFALRVELRSCGDAQAPIGGGVNWSHAAHEGLRYRAIPQGDNLVLSGRASNALWRISRLE
jgi:hypothetical protein